MSINLIIVVEYLITAQWETINLYISLFTSFVYFPFYFRTPVFQHGTSLISIAAG